jgi:hypothetical protein
MKTLLLSFVVGLAMLSSAAADPVDLRDKKGVVDPKDLKKNDPKESPVRIKEPPPPERTPDVPPFSVKKSGDTTEHQHIGNQ